MADLHFIYSVMGAGKSLRLLQNEYGYRDNHFKTLLLTNSVDTRWGTGEVITRFARDNKGNYLSKEAYSIDKIKKNEILTRFPGTEVIFVDEVQFFDRQSILELSDIVDDYDIDVFCYGLKIDSNGNMWPGAKALLEATENTENLKMLCKMNKCKCMATHILRYDANGNVVRNGPRVQVGDAEYKSVCRHHWKKEYYSRKR